MRLPKILAVIVAAMMVAGLVSGLVVGLSHLSKGGPGVPTTGRFSTGIYPPATVAPTTSDPPTTAPVRSPARASLVHSGRSLGLQAPASGVPVGPLASGSASSPTVPPASGVAAASITTLPTPTSASLPAVKPLKSVVNPDAVVILPASMTPTEDARVARIPGMAAIETVDTGTVQMSGAPVVIFGVDAATFRAFTPSASASSNRLWQYLAGGSLVASYEMATDRELTLGTESTLVPAGTSRSTVQGWLGAFAAIGLPGVDLLVSNQFSPDLGLVPDSGLVVSAPDVLGPTLQSELESAVPGAAVELLREDQFPQDIPGNTLTAQMRETLLQAALSKVGDPYVWGGAGPADFDCSGLVQWSYRQAGILMPRTAAEQFLTGDHIPLADAVPGDLLFWTYDPNDPGFVDHIAIYLGNGMMVEAPHTGLDVEVVPVPTADFAGVVEVVLR